MCLCVDSVVFTVQSSVWFAPGVVLGVGIGLFASCQLLHALYVWVAGSVHCPSLVILLMQNSIKIMYSCVCCVCVMFILHWCIVSIGYCLEYS